MAKDYAKKKNGKKKPGASRDNKRSPLSVKLIIMSLLIMGAMIAFLIYLKLEHNPTNSQKKDTTKSQTAIGKKTTEKILSKKKMSQKAASKKTTLKTGSSKNINADKTDNNPEEIPFYLTHEEMLNKTVEIPIEDLKLSNDEHKYVYTMPCGSFRQNQRAEELKAKIAMTGYKSTINEVKAKSGVWHRVALGPFKSKRKAESIRHRLQDNAINYCKIYRKQVD